MSIAHEVNFDGIVGPTHNYAGLSCGNLASQSHRRMISNPKAAALEGLEKMKLLADMRFRQAVLPPALRPDVDALRRLGFHGTDAQILQEAAHDDPAILAACSSASAMWAANAATVSPSADTTDHRVHFTSANLISHLHRSLEAPTTAAALQEIFSDSAVFAHHPPLPAAAQLSDEGAANHTRLCREAGGSGVEIFTYGRRSLSASQQLPTTFPARQTLEASAAIARLHQLAPDRTVFVQQSPAAIDAGVFHNDVIAVGNQNVLLYHADAWCDMPAAIDEIRTKFVACCGDEPVLIEVSASEVPLADAVSSYLFNSQLLTLPDGTMLLLAPVECLHLESTRRFLEALPARGTPIHTVRYVDVRQSMQNGGGPACLRLRVVLTDEELKRVHPGVFLTDRLYHDLKAWIERHYRDRLAPEDLADPKLLEESRTALGALDGLLGLNMAHSRRA